MSDSGREMPKPVREDSWSKTWVRDELDDPEGSDSFIWKYCIRDPIGLAMADSINDPEKDFYIDFSHGASDVAASMTRRRMEDLFYRIDLPDEVDSEEFNSLKHQLSEEIYYFYTNETEGSYYFRFQVAAVTSEDRYGMDELSDGSFFD
jgi:hypothetical protein